MPDFTVKDPPEYNDKMQMLEPTDRAHADVFNALFEKLLNNEAFLKLAAERLAQTVMTHLDSETSHVTAQDKENWNAKAGTTAATQDAAGLMGAEDKKKLDGVAKGAEVNQSAFSNIAVGAVTIAANGKTATFILEAGDNITLTADNATKKINIKANRDGGNADMVDGYHAAYFAVADHGHDGRYYTKNESNTLLNNKANSSHTHNASAINGLPTSLPANGGNADTATKAINDGNGKNIANTYALKEKYTNYGIKVGQSAPNTIGNYSIAMGESPYVPGKCSIGMGNYVEATGNYSFANGVQTEASGKASFASGKYTEASGEASFASGAYTITSGEVSFASGDNTRAANYASFAVGKYNVSMTNGGTSSNKVGHAFVIGNGTYGANSNALSLMYSGILKTAGTITASTAADYAEFFEWQDGNPDTEDRVGHFVTLDGDKIRIADAGDTYILGIVSGRPFVLGNGDCDTWTGMCLHDEFNREIMEPAPKIELVEITEEMEREIEEVDEETGETIKKKVTVRIVTGHTEREVLDADGNPVYEGTRPKLNPDYDHTQKYISRFDRPEWSPVGMLGVLAVYDDGSCQVNGYCTVADGGIATAAEGEYMLAGGKLTKGYRVVARVADDIVKVVFR